LAATEASQIEVATEIPYEEFGDSEYLYVIAVAQSTASEMTMTVQSRELKEKIKTVNKDPLGINTSSSSMNLPLVIGLIFAVLGFIAIIVSIVYLIMKKNKAKKNQEFNDVRRIKKKAPQKKNI
jgi:hypothetical protein